MCLGIAIRRPGDVLATGEHNGLQWQVIHNRMGYRCGYVRIPVGHPRHGQHYDEIDATVHGGLTFAEADEACDKDGEDNAWWIGFGCAHAGDMPDPSLPRSREGDMLYESMMGIGNFAEAIIGKGVTGFCEGVRSQEYVEAQCRSLCDQAVASGGA